MNIFTIIGMGLISFITHCICYPIIVVFGLLIEINTTVIQAIRYRDLQFYRYSIYYNTIFHTIQDLLWVPKNLARLFYWVVTQITPASGKYSELNPDNIQSWIYLAYIVPITLFTILCWPIAIPLIYAIDISYNLVISNNPWTVYQGDPTLPTNRDNVYYYFLNGICNTPYILRLNCQKMEAAWNVQVHGIYNASYGVLMDFLECLFQRNFNADSYLVQQTAAGLISKLRDPEQPRVVFMAHSQGGIIANLVVQRIYLELASWHQEHLLRHLRVVTFACAAKEFINPNGLIPRIDHYVNVDRVNELTGDLVGMNIIAYDRQRIGTAQCYNDVEGNVYISSQPSWGHLFGTYYSLNPTDYRNHPAPQFNRQPEPQFPPTFDSDIKEENQIAALHIIKQLIS